MLIDPNELKTDLDRLEEIEKASLRMVTQAIYNYREIARDIFWIEEDKPADIAEDVTREALDRLGMPRIDQRLFGKVDYKRACYQFHPEYAVKQALFVDSKAETIAGSRTATLQMSQMSMTVKQLRSGTDYIVPGALPMIVPIGGSSYLTVTIFVKYNYEERITDSGESRKSLQTITVVALPNGMLQDKYNPDVSNTIWLVGRNAPSLGEDFRVRLDFRALKRKAGWRVQTIPMPPAGFTWDS